MRFLRGKISRRIQPGPSDLSCFRTYVPLVLRIPLTKSEQQILKTLAPIFNILEEKGTITNSDIQRILKVSRVQASRIARDLVEWGLLVREGLGRGAHYKRAPK